jgi:hypothetical protein
MSEIQRAWLLFLVFFLVGGMCWLDSFDLTDDIPLSQRLQFEQQAIEPEEGREHLLSLVHGAPAVWFVVPVASPSKILPISSALFVSPQSDPPLYQRLSTYRI